MITGVKLAAPDARFKRSFLEALDEFPVDEEAIVSERRMATADYEEYVRLAEAWSQGNELPSGWVAATTRWLVDGDEYIGTTNIRHQLSDYLLRIGGHIGYAIRPARRRQGNGTEICRLALDEARLLGLDRVLITCDDTNLGSRKIIERNGGVLEDVVKQPDSNVPKRRYWVTL
jgi:predicted acetyltransferase